MNLSEELSWRGFVNQTTYSDLLVLNDKPISFYLGVDPSADSMTIGNLAAIMLVKYFIKHGHRAYLLVGGATGLIGDPDGKVDERNLKTNEEIQKNKNGIISQYNKLFKDDEIKIVDNYDWFVDMNYLGFLREIGKYIPMSQMLDRDFVKTRLGNGGNGISYAEFSYSLIQGYDFLHLYRKYDVTLQICGADQWGNSVTGVDLVRRLEKKEVNVLSLPLVVNKTTGVKFGKSEEGAVWLDSEKTSIFKFYQFWLNVDDAGVIDYLKIYTMLDKPTINDLEKEMKDNPNKRSAQKVLAHEVTKFVHGKQRAENVERVTDVLFGGADFNSLNDNELEMLASEIPRVDVGKTIIEALIETNTVDSNNEARRLIEGGAISVNSGKINSDRVINNKSLIKKGKNSFILVY